MTSSNKTPDGRIQDQYLHHLVRTDLTTDKSEIHWWDDCPPAANATANAFTRDVVKLMLRKEIKTADIEQHWYRIYAPDAGSKATVCNLLNNVCETTRMLHMRIEDGRVVQYSKRTKFKSGERTCVTLSSIKLPTLEYAEWYKWLLDNPAMHHLCIISTTVQQWRVAIRRSDAKVPGHISAWLYRTVHHKPS